MLEIEIHPITPKDEDWTAQKLTNYWGSPLVISRGQIHDASKLPGFVALHQDEKVGLVTYRFDDEECKLVMLDSWRENIGVGSSLIEAVKRAALKAGCSRLWPITTNDNLYALGFYQKRGFQHSHLSSTIPPPPKLGYTCQMGSERTIHQHPSD